MSKPENRIFWRDPLYKKIKQKENCLSPYSKFYFYKDKIYEKICGICGRRDDLLYLIDDPRRKEKILKKFDHKLEQKRIKELNFMKSLRKACLISNLIKEGAYKFKVEEKCCISEVKRIVYKYIEDFLREYFNIEEAYCSSYFHSYTFIPVYNPEADEIGYFIDHNSNCLNLSAARFGLIDYQLYEKYFFDKGKDIEVPVRNILRQTNNRFELMDI